MARCFQHPLLGVHHHQCPLESTEKKSDVDESSMLCHITYGDAPDNHGQASTPSSGDGADGSPAEGSTPASVKMVVCQSLMAIRPAWTFYYYASQLTARVSMNATAERGVERNSDGGTSNTVFVCLFVPCQWG